jgi:chromosome segregation ATPase
VLDALKKKLLGDTTQEKQLEEVQEAVVEASEAPLAQMNELSSQLAELAGTVETLNSVIAEKDALLAELNGKIAELSVFADEAQARAEAVAAEAKAKEVESRKEMLAAVIGADNPGFDTTFAAIGALDDAAFSVVVEGFRASFAKEADSIMFKELGVSGEAEKLSSETGLNIKKFLPKKKESK